MSTEINFRIWKIKSARLGIECLIGLAIYFGTGPHLARAEEDPDNLSKNPLITAPGKPYVNELLEIPIAKVIPGGGGRATKFAKTILTVNPDRIGGEDIERLSEYDIEVLRQNINLEARPVHGDHRASFEQRRKKYESMNTRQKRKFRAESLKRLEAIAGVAGDYLANQVSIQHPNRNILNRRVLGRLIDTIAVASSKKNASKGLKGKLRRVFKSAPEDLKSRLIDEALFQELPKSKRRLRSVGLSSAVGLNDLTEAQIKKLTPDQVTRLRRSTDLFDGTQGKFGKKTSAGFYLNQEQLEALRAQERKKGERNPDKSELIKKLESRLKDLKELRVLKSHVRSLVDAGRDQIFPTQESKVAQSDPQRTAEQRALSEITQRAIELQRRFPDGPILEGDLYNLLVERVTEKGGPENLKKLGKLTKLGGLELRLNALDAYLDQHEPGGKVGSPNLAVKKAFLESLELKHLSAEQIKRLDLKDLESLKNKVSIEAIQHVTSLDALAALDSKVRERLAEIKPEALKGSPGSPKEFRELIGKVDSINNAVIAGLEHELKSLSRGQDSLKVAQHMNNLLDRLKQHEGLLPHAAMITGRAPKKEFFDAIFKEVYQSYLDNPGSAATAKAPAVLDKLLHQVADRSTLVDKFFELTRPPKTVPPKVIAIISLQDISPKHLGRLKPGDAQHLKGFSTDRYIALETQGVLQSKAQLKSAKVEQKRLVAREIKDYKRTLKQVDLAVLKALPKDPHIKKEIASRQRVSKLKSGISTIKKHGVQAKQKIRDYFRKDSRTPATGH